MVTVVADNLEVCEDCAMIINNGTLGAEDDATDSAHAARMMAAWGEDTRGLVLTCSAEDEDTCPEFSTRPCEGCGSTLAGSRHRAAVLR